MLQLYQGALRNDGTLAIRLSKGGQVKIKLNF